MPFLMFVFLLFFSIKNFFSFDLKVVFPHPRAMEVSCLGHSALNLPGHSHCWLNFDPDVGVVFCT